MLGLGDMVSGKVSGSVMVKIRGCRVSVKFSVYDAMWWVGAP